MERLQKPQPVPAEKYRLLEENIERQEATKRYPWHEGCHRDANKMQQENLVQRDQFPLGRMWKQNRCYLRSLRKRAFSMCMYVSLGQGKAKSEFQKQHLLWCFSLPTHVVSHLGSAILSLTRSLGPSNTTKPLKQMMPDKFLISLTHRRMSPFFFTFLD